MIVTGKEIMCGLLPRMVAQGCRENRRIITRLSRLCRLPPLGSKIRAMPLGGLRKNVMVTISSLGDEVLMIWGNDPGDKQTGGGHP